MSVRQRKGGSKKKQDQGQEKDVTAAAVSGGLLSRYQSFMKAHPLTGGMFQQGSIMFCAKLTIQLLVRTSL